MWRAFIEQAALAGQLDAREYQVNREGCLAVEWHTPKWSWVGPEKPRGFGLPAAGRPFRPPALRPAC